MTEPAVDPRDENLVMPYAPEDDPEAHVGESTVADDWLDDDDPKEQVNS